MTFGRQSSWLFFSRQAVFTPFLKGFWQKREPAQITGALDSNSFPSALIFRPAINPPSLQLPFCQMWKHR
jgi:hypothetical protein